MSNGQIKRGLVMGVFGRRAGGGSLVGAGLGGGEDSECGDSWSRCLGAGTGAARSADLLTTCPGQTESRGRLQGVAELRLAGLELTDASLRLLLRHAPQLSALDLSHCAHVGDPSVHLLTAPTSPLRETLVHLNLAGKHSLCPSH